MRLASVFIAIYSLVIFFLLLQIANCERDKHCGDNERCLKKLKSSNGKTENYEEVYKQKYEKYAASRNKIENKEIPLDKKCNKRKYQLNCNRSQQKNKSGEQSMKNGKVYIKRENNPLLNIDNDDENDPKRKRSAPSVTKTKEKYKKNSWKPQPEKLKIDSSSEESDDEW